MTNGSFFKQVLNVSNPFALLVLNEIEKHRSPSDIVTIINDEDIHQGRIFNKEGQNGYDLLIFTRQEFITQQFYDNLKKFVKDGGSAIFINSDAFNSKVFYNDINKNITLIEGKYWKFNGTAAEKTNIELPFFNENKEFIGSNFLPIGINDNITFQNNPFDYVHYKENYINKPNVTIIYDYNAQIPRENPYLDSVVATYETYYGKGKIVVFSLYVEKIFSNPSFQKFFHGILQSTI